MIRIYDAARRIVHKLLRGPGGYRASLAGKLPLWQRGSPPTDKPIVQFLLGLMGALLGAAGLWGYFGEQDDKIAGGILLAGLLLVVLAAFFPRIDGIVELGELKIPIGKARRAEKQLEQGQVVEAGRIESAWKALEDTLSKYSVSQVGTPTVTQGAPPAEPEIATPERQEAQSGSRPVRRSVQLVDDAVFTVGTLTNEQQQRVQMEIARMSAPGFQPESDPKAIRRRDGGSSYHVRRVANTDLRLWHRPLNGDDPASPLVVMVIEKKGEA